MITFFLGPKFILRKDHCSFLCFLMNEQPFKSFL
jgi:hypothetical protein